MHTPLYYSASLQKALIHSLHWHGNPWYIIPDPAPSEAVVDFHFNCHNLALRALNPSKSERGGSVKALRLFQFQLKRLRFLNVYLRKWTTISTFTSKLE